MKKYVRVINQDNKLCEVGEGTDVDFYTSIGMEETEVEQAYNGDWYLLGYAPQIPLENAKALKQAELLQLKTEKLSTINYKGIEYQIDTDSKLNINGKVSAILLAQSTEQPITQVNWIAKDNSITQFTALEFLAFSNAVAQYIETILFLNDTIRTQINEAESIEALRAIELKLENEA